MPNPLADIPAPPFRIAIRLPRAALLREALLGSIVTLPAGQPLVRAAWNLGSVFPARVDATHRFGPPAECRREGGFPFHWIYAAGDEMTAVWEAGLCGNDVTDPGTFYVRPGARGALIASLRFAVPLELIDLSGTTLSKLGLSDDISSPDHEFTQWLGCMIDAVIAEQASRVAGFAYPSRKHRGHQAIAISSRSVEALTPHLFVTHQPFGNTAACALLEADSCCRPAPR